MALLIHREIKDEQVIPLARLLGAISYPDFMMVDNPKSTKEKPLPQIKEAFVPPTFEQHLMALQQYIAGHFDRDFNNYLTQLAQEDPEVKAKREELEALINSKKG